MWRKFKIDMFITSFIPLWISIVLLDCWCIIDAICKKWDCQIRFKENLIICLNSCLLQIVSIFLILTIVTVSIIGVNSFLKDRTQSKNNHKGTIQKATKANKLSSEFLLAYILPMIAFDFGDIKSIVLFLVYFFVLAFLCIRNNNLYTNILLEFKGYKMYTCDLAIDVLGKEHVYYDSLVISGEDLTQMEKNEISYWDFDNYIYIRIAEEKQK